MKATHTDTHKRQKRLRVLFLVVSVMAMAVIMAASFANAFDASGPLEIQQAIGADDIVQPIVDSIEGILGGIATTIQSFFTNLFTETTGTGDTATTTISTFAIVSIVLFAVSIGLGLVYKLMGKVGR